MEDVLAVYTRPHDPAHPLVCLDETSKLKLNTAILELIDLGSLFRFLNLAWHYAASG